MSVGVFAVITLLSKQVSIIKRHVEMIGIKMNQQHEADMRRRLLKLA